MTFFLTSNFASADLNTDDEIGHTLQCDQIPSTTTADDHLKNISCLRDFINSENVLINLRGKSTTDKAFIDAVG